MLLSSKSLELLKQGKNLLAFSGGIDSTALFFLLLEENIEFDIALINYHTRESSNQEALYARELAQSFEKKCFIKEVLLSPSNFEHQARKLRYQFFNDIIENHHYNNLLTAHHLGDRLEWFLMQLTKGAGLVEILGFNEVEERENYNLIRPLLHTDKSLLKEYLDQKNIHYFIDESNYQLHHKRNYFRQKFATPLLEEFKRGIQKSFHYLDIDKKTLFDIKIITKIEALHILQKGEDDTHTIRQIDKILKQNGYLLSASQKEEILKKRDLVIGNLFSVVITEDKIFIAPYNKTPMPKNYKELCRRKKIPPKIRPYLYTIGYDFSESPWPL